MDSQTKLIVVLTAIIIFLGIAFAFRVIIFNNKNVSDYSEKSSLANEEDIDITNKEEIDKEVKHKTYVNNKNVRSDTNEVLYSVLKLIFDFICICIIYNMFEKQSFSKAASINIAYNVIKRIIGKTGLIGVLGGVAVAYIFTLFFYILYCRSRSFFTFLLRVIVFYFFLYIALLYIVGRVIINIGFYF